MEVKFSNYCYRWSQIICFSLLFQSYSRYNHSYKTRSYFEVIHPIILRAIDTLHKCNRIPFSSVCTLLINYFAKYLNPKIKEDSYLIEIAQAKAYQIYTTCNDPTIIISIASLLFYIGFPSNSSHILNPLLRMLHMSTSYSLPAYSIIYDHLDLLIETQHYYHWFFPKETDSTPVCIIKLKILCKICNASNISQVIQELEYWSR